MNWLPRSWRVFFWCRLRGLHAPCNRRRTRPVKHECLWRATLSWDCAYCGESFSEHRWAFMREAGALSWIAGGYFDEESRP